MSFLSKLFGKKFQDESFQKQRSEVEEQSRVVEAKFGQKMIIGEGCDEIPNAQGMFGHNETNPIPVNGNRGEMKYLNRLRCQCGAALIFHRIGSKKYGEDGCDMDVYETVCIEGKHWDTLYLNMYYSRRSTLLPKGYHFSDFHPFFSKFTLGFGVNEKCDNFPFGMPEALARKWGDSLGEKFAANLEKIIGDGTKFRRKNIPETS